VAVARAGGLGLPDVGLGPQGDEATLQDALEPLLVARLNAGRARRRVAGDELGRGPINPSRLFERSRPPSPSERTSATPLLSAARPRERPCDLAAILSGLVTAVSEGEGCDSAAGRRPHPRPALERAPRCGYLSRQATTGILLAGAATRDDQRRKADEEEARARPDHEDRAIRPERRLEEAMRFMRDRPPRVHS
jgi:hypothetical protein